MRRTSRTHGAAFGLGAAALVLLAAVIDGGAAVAATAGAAILAVLATRAFVGPRRAADPARDGRRDPLTGSATRPVLSERLVHAVAAADRTGRTVAVLFLDLDGFKALNDEFHHDVGDHVLMEVARRLGDVPRRTDLVCRYGGDEFVILLEHVDGPDGVAAVANKLLEAVRAPIHVDGYTFEIGASIGIALYPGAGDDPSDLVRRADAAMYVAKQSGGGAYRFSTSDLRADHAARQETLAALRSAIGGGDLSLAYQPLVDLQTGQAIGAEALLRWSRPGRDQPLTAGGFIDLTEATELADRIGSWVADRAVAQLAAWDRSGEPAWCLSINAAARHLKHGGLADELRAALTRHGVSPDRVLVEVPTSLLVDDPDRTLGALRQLDRVGVRIVLDGFGHGLTPITLLAEVPMYAVKLAGTMTARLGRDDEVVAALVALARGLGAEVMVPQLEHPTQLARARALGIRIGQGFLLGRPTQADDVRANGTAAVDH